LNLQLQLVHARQGVQWIRQGFGVFMTRSSSFALLFGVLMLGVLVLQSLSWPGTVVMLACMPLMSLWFVLLTHQVLAQEPIGLVQTLRAPFVTQGTLPTADGLKPSRHLRALALLGLIQVLAVVLIYVLGDWLDGGALQKLMEQAATASGEATKNVITADEISADVQIGLFVRLGLGAALSIPFWHAPMLVYWGAYSAPKALFASTLAIWHNRGAFALYVLGWLSLGITVLTILSMLSTLVGSAALTALLLPTAWLVLCTVFYASLYFTFAACFAVAQ
jgi:hypothetical protein